MIGALFKRTFWFAALGFSTLAIQAYATVPTATGMSLSWVGQELNHNGRPMTILHFSSAETADETLRFYRDAWQKPLADNIPPYIENNIGDWKVISRLSGDDSWVVQVRDKKSGGAEGYISDMSMSASVTIPPEVGRFPQMTGSLLISYTSSADTHARGLTLVLKSPHSVRASAEFYLAKLSSEGFSISNKQIDAESATLFFADEKSKVDVAVGRADDGGSLIFANLISND